MTLRKEASSSSLLSASAEDNPQDRRRYRRGWVGGAPRELFSLPPLSRLSFSLLPLSHYFPSVPSLFSLHLLLPLLFLSIPTPFSP